jgi:hypothetical protein
MGLGHLFLDFLEINAIGALTVFAVLLALRFGVPARSGVTNRRTIQ